MPDAFSLPNYLFLLLFTPPTAWPCKLPQRFRGNDFGEGQPRRAGPRHGQSGLRRLLPAINAHSSFTPQRFSPNQVPSFGELTANDYRTALDLSYEIDLWGRFRRGFESARAEA